MQDVLGKIRESKYDDKWSNGTEKNIIASAKLYSPLACTSSDPENIRVYYLSTENTINDVTYEKSKGWYEGNLGKERFITAPYSKLAACHPNGPYGTIRVYCQMADNTIQEYGLKGFVSWDTKTIDSVYFQHMEHGIIEKCYDSKRGWYGGGAKLPKVQPRTSIACTSYMTSSETVGIRVFYNTSNTMREMVYDGKSWTEGHFLADCIPGTQIACISWMNGPRPEVRVYFQAGHEISAITEYVWTQGRWSSGKLALPPA
ncbi:uncharacterized protein N7518_000776 [Penicillium psychrosexuale]|uniref:uncharacterized protein n=1 Tax=Penicillium psychrosexuale TaxID=1002107 RepID=UPI0025457E38|nr:uncharacterized protein N7518_000776 [Penicillium psychrosexuale]KAJ5804473.1 hypothetical protein N7518_000776 [Penicillium psychrosexuale]